MPIIEPILNYYTYKNNMSKQAVLLSLAGFSMLVLSAMGHAREEIKVGLYHFPPFSITKGEQVGGLAIEMLAVMNARQDKFEFIPVATSPSTRHKVLSLGRCDISMFEELEWGWENYDVDITEPFLDGEEVYIALAKPGRDQSYFDSFDNKTMVGVKGYHYRFADFNSNQEYLQNTFNMQLTPSNLGSIKMVLQGERGDIAVVTRSFLRQYMNDHPEQKNLILISDKIDQTYHLSAVLRKGIALDIATLNGLLKTLNEDGSFAPLWETIRVNTGELVSP
jgi:polar amino acid transport system substrate-binding protein